MFNRKIVGLLLVLIALSVVVAGVAAIGEKTGDVNYNGSGRLAGHIYVKDYNNGSVNIMDHHTSSGHYTFNAQIPNECKYHTIDITQHVAGTPADCHILIYMYDGGNITIKYNIVGNLCKAKASHLYVTYKNKTVEANNHNGYYTIWEPS